MKQTQVEIPISRTWDQRLEKFGWYEEMANHVSDRGVTLSITHNERNQEVMIMHIENVHMTKPRATDGLPIHNLKIEADESTGRVKIYVPFRKVVAGFAEAFRSIVRKNNPQTGERNIESGPKSTFSGYFFFNILDLDDPRHQVEFQCRSDFNDDDIGRRRMRRIT